MKQATGCRCVSSHSLHPSIDFESQTDKPSPTWFWGSKQETVAVILRSKSLNRRSWFYVQTKKLSQWFWGQTTDKSLPLTLRLNWKTRASRLLHVYDVDRTRYHPTSLSFGHRVPDLLPIIPDPPHQVPYSCLDPRRCPPCRIRHIHIMTQANMFLHTK
jgi:hypothetical protein